MAELFSTTVSLKLGSEQPADPPAELLTALRGIEVIHGSRCPSGFRLSFQADRYPPVEGSLADYPLLDTGLLDPFVRAQVLVQAAGGSTDVLIDGFITRQEITVDEQQGATLSVLGEDVSVKMDLFEISAEYPSLTDSAIVEQILGKYGSLGITPEVTAPEGESAPQDYVPQQNSTDRFYLQVLAARYAFEFYIQPGSQAGENTAYWGPPVTTGDRQPALTANMGRANNLRTVTLSYDSLAPTLAYGMVLDLTQSPATSVSVAAGSANPTPGLSTTPGIPAGVSPLAQDPTSFTSQLSTLGTRGSLLLHPGLDVSRAQSLAQAKTNRSVERVAVVEGEIDTARYGAVLIAPGLVDLRGVGNRYDGTYRVRQVRHLLSLEQGEWSYLQRFVLVRGGLGSTITEVEETSGI